jgi:hypothetical protein
LSKSLKHTVLYGNICYGNKYLTENLPIWILDTINPFNNKNWCLKLYQRLKKLINHRITENQTQNVTQEMVLRQQFCSVVLFHSQKLLHYGLIPLNGIVRCNWKINKRKFFQKERDIIYKPHFFRQYFTILLLNK